MALLLLRLGRRTAHATRCPAWEQPTCVGTSNHAVHFGLSLAGFIQRLAPDVIAKNNGQMLLVVDIVGIQVEEHLGAADGGDAGPNNAIDLGQRF